jgi:hypothetical protein
MLKRTALLVVLAIIALPVICLLSVLVSTRQSMTQFRTRLLPGMTVAELHNFVGGPPAKILHRGDPLQQPNRSYTFPTINEHTAIYVYPKEGIPYYIVYVFVDELRGAVIRSDVEQLGSWW